MTNESKSAASLKTIERALSVLEFVAAAPTPPNMRDVSVALDHNLSSTYNIVNTLLAAGYLSRDGVGALRIGSRVSFLAAGLERTNDYARMLRPFVEEVSASSGETIYLTRHVGDRVVIQIVMEGRGSLRVSGLEVGFYGSEDRRASGKAIMAFISEDECVSIIRASHPGEDAAKLSARLEALRPELEKIRQVGYAVDDEVFEPGVCCIAAPYFDDTGRVAGSLAASAPAVRRNTLWGAIKEDVLSATQKMSLALGSPNASQPERKG